jgi:hypothetical protein
VTETAALLPFYVSKLLFRFSENGHSGSAGEKDLARVVEWGISNTAIPFTLNLSERVKNIPRSLSVC